METHTESSPSSPSSAPFTCVRCKQVFEKEGLAVEMHSEVIGRVCPECLAGKAKVTVVLVRDVPKRIFTIGYVDTEDDKTENLPAPVVKVQ